MQGECNCCGKISDLRIGYCFDCADAESIIDEGLDMFDKGLNNTKIAAKTPMEKLLLLKQKGWDLRINVLNEIDSKPKPSFIKYIKNYFR